MKPYCKVVPNKDILFSELFIIMSDFSTLGTKLLFYLFVILLLLLLFKKNSVGFCYQL